MHSATANVGFLNAVVSLYFKALSSDFDAKREMNLKNMSSKDDFADKPFAFSSF